MAVILEFWFNELELMIVGELPEIQCSYMITSGDENHLCGASLRRSHKISLKAHRHACTYGVGTPIAKA